MSAVLVLDWGIGGLATFERLRRRAPQLSLSYVSDSGYMPYGRVPPDALGSRLEALCERLKPEALFIACNAASSALREGLSLPELTLGIIDAGVEATLLALEALDQGVKAPRAGIIGGLGTIQAGHYERLLRRAWGARGPLELRSEPAQALSAHVEAGRLSGPTLEADLDELCDRLGSLDTLTLACTHYPALIGPLKARLPDVTLVDPVERFVEQACDALARQGLLSSTSPSPQPPVLYTTGDPELLRHSAQAAWGITLSSGCRHLNLSPHAEALYEPR